MKGIFQISSTLIHRICLLIFKVHIDTVVWQVLTLDLTVACTIWQGQANWLLMRRSLTSLITACQQIHMFSLLYLPLTFRSAMWPLHPSIVFTWLRCINLCWHLVVGAQQRSFCSSLITATVLVFSVEPEDVFYIPRLWHFS